MTLGTALRAGRVLAGALMARSGPRAHRAGLMTGGIVVLAAAGAVTAYAAAGPREVVSGDRAAIEAVVRDYILAHPEIIPEAMQRLKAKQAAAAVDANRAALETPYQGAWEGAAKPDVTMVAFMDYACGYCRASLPDIARLLKEDPGLRVVYHELPIISRESVGAAKVSLYAAEAGHFPAFHKAMYEEGQVSPETVLDAARKAGLDGDKVKAVLASKERDRTLTSNVELAQALNASGTPLFVIDDQVFDGAVGYDALKQAIAQARDKEKSAG